MANSADIALFVEDIFEGYLGHRRCIRFNHEASQ